MTILVPGPAECAERLESAASAEGGPACGTALHSSGSRWVLALLGALRVPPFSLKSLHRKWPRTFFSIFWPSKQCFKICFEKMTKKVRKSRFSASQKPPKILPKRFRKRCSKKQTIFHRFLLQRASVAKAPTSILYWFLQYKMALGRFSSCCFFHGFGIQKPSKNLLKTMPGRPKNRSRKHVVFEYRFFRILASILEALGPPTWSQVGSKCLRRA